ncbi:MAG TPA: acetyl-CoA decarbonylase/synthase complex subunit gamma, partial [Dongiaceae bacterium]|nr:acetyl-CoA decarbonylase/synthase complex subunit gamma [Dongiaceae bacterium]
MALTGLQIQKLLPATNCKECGSNTCLAFAMKLAAKKAELAQCPYASEEAKRVLGAASEPPVRCVELGPDRKLKLGGEVVLYRHEKTFMHQTALALNVNDTDPPATIEATLKTVAEYCLERVGEELRLDLVAVTQRGPEAKAFVELATRAWVRTGHPLILRSPDAAALASAAAAVKGSRSLLRAPSAEAAAQLWGVAKENDHALALTAPDLNQLVALAAGIKAQGFNNLLLEFTTFSPAEQFQTNSIARRAALKDGLKALGYPTLRFVQTGNLLDDTLEAVNEITKYGGICVLPEFDAAQMASLMTLRLNLYTDPQKPIQVEPKVYPIGEPRPDSPIFVTTNFSLTYFIVSGEIENCGLSA